MEMLLLCQSQIDKVGGIINFSWKKYISDHSCTYFGNNTAPTKTITENFSAWLHGRQTEIPTEISASMLDNSSYVSSERRSSLKSLRWCCRFVLHKSINFK